MPVDEAEQVSEVEDLTDAEAGRAGFADRAAVLKGMRDGVPHRVELRYAGADPRIAPREHSKLSIEDRQRLNEKLSAMGRRAENVPWTGETPDLTAADPGFVPPSSQAGGAEQ